MRITIHGVTDIELVDHFPTNGGQRTVRITYRDKGRKEMELTLYGNTTALKDLPQAEDFHVYGEQR